MIARRQCAAWGAGAMATRVMLAQTAGVMPTVGMLSLEFGSTFARVRESLGKLGHVEGRNVRFEAPRGGGPL